MLQTAAFQTCARSQASGDPWPANMRFFAIGDIHGCSTALRRLDSELAFRSSDIVVTLGDYIDRGPDSQGVIDFLLELGQRCQLIALRGNHELMALQARESSVHLQEWMTNGGDATLHSYGVKTPVGIPAAHWAFLESTVAYHEAAQDFFVHANAYSDLSLQDQPDYMLFWEFLVAPPGPHVSGRRMVCGHTAQKSGKPLDLGHAVCIDTHAHGGGWLTCLEVRTNLYWQASEKGSFRDDSL